MSRLCCGEMMKMRLKSKLVVVVMVLVIEVLMSWVFVYLSIVESMLKLMVRVSIVLSWLVRR